MIIRSRNRVHWDEDPLPCAGRARHPRRPSPEKEDMTLKTMLPTGAALSLGRCGVPVQ
ncbi:hypothetical protein [Azospirillum doebereinerae]